MSNEPFLQIERDSQDAFAVFTMNRPDKLNALDLDLLEAIGAAMRTAQDDPDIRAIVLTGAGRAFTTGFDLVSDDFEMDAAGWQADMNANCERLRVIWDSKVPVIAAINGYALAGGLELAMCCDLAIAAEDAMLGEPEVRHASGPPSLMMPWTVPIRHVRWLMYTGDIIDGREAERIHLVNKAVPGDHLMDEAKRLARKLARIPGPSVAMTKATLNHYQKTAGLSESWQYNVETISQLHASEHGRTWMRKLKEKPLKDFLDEREAPFKDLD